jgi:hypothetical protein
MRAASVAVAEASAHGNFAKKATATARGAGSQAVAVNRRVDTAAIAATAPSRLDVSAWGAAKNNKATKTLSGEVDKGGHGAL